MPLHHNNTVSYLFVLEADFTNLARSEEHMSRGVLSFLLRMDRSAPSCTRKQAITALSFPSGISYS